MPGKAGGTKKASTISCKWLTAQSFFLCETTAFQQSGFASGSVSGSQYGSGSGSGCRSSVLSGSGSSVLSRAVPVLVPVLALVPVLVLVVAYCEQWSSALVNAGIK